jgi:single-strand DNA-binding protein
MNETTTTVIGNLVADPELRFTKSGRAVATVRVASTPRFQDHTGEWRDGSTLFLSCTIWGQQAENVAESLVRGHKVIVRGRLKQRDFQTRAGERRTVVELDAEDIGACLSNATVKVAKARRSTGFTAPVEAEANPWDGQTTTSARIDPWTGAPIPAQSGT